jgi:hypothetical protein
MMLGNENVLRVPCPRLYRGQGFWVRRSMPKGIDVLLRVGPSALHCVLAVLVGDQGARAARVVGERGGAGIGIGNRRHLTPSAKIEPGFGMASAGAPPAAAPPHQAQMRAPAASTRLKESGIFSPGSSYVPRENKRPLFSCVYELQLRVNDLFSQPCAKHRGCGVPPPAKSFLFNAAASGLRSCFATSPLCRSATSS